MQAFTLPQRNSGRAFAAQQRFTFGQSAEDFVAPRRYRVAWISDADLGTRGCNAAALLDFLRENDFDTLYVVGDLIDIWSLRRGIYWPQQHNDVIQKILRKARKGTHVIYIPGNHVRRGKRNAVVARALNDQRGCCFGREAVHWLQFHHTMAERANDSPAASSCSYRHRYRAKTDHPFGQHEDRRFEKIQPGWEMIKTPSFRAGKKCQCNNAHGFLGIISPVAVRHPRCAEDLQFAKQ